MNVDIQFTKRFHKEAKGTAFREALPDITKYITEILQGGPRHAKSRMKHMSRGKLGSIWRLRLSLKDAAPHRLMFKWISNGTTPTLLLLCFVPRSDKQYDTKHASNFEKLSNNIVDEARRDDLKGQLLGVNIDTSAVTVKQGEDILFQEPVLPKRVEGLIAESDEAIIHTDEALEETSELLDNEVEEADVDDLVELYATKDLIHKFATTQGFGPKMASQLSEYNTTDDAIEFIKCFDEDLVDRFLNFLIDDESNNDLDRIRKVPSQEFGSVSERPLSSFMLAVDPEQQLAIDRSIGSKPYMVRGSAGTGKSLVCLYRLKRMLQERVNESLFDGKAKPKYLFLSYTNSLVESCRSLFNELTADMDLSDVDIKFCTLDKELSNISKGLYKKGLRVPQTSSAAINSAYVEVLKSSCTADQVRSLLKEMGSSFFINEVEEVIIDKRINNIEEYLETGAQKKSLRKGLVVPLNEKYRRAIWVGYEHLLKRKSYVSWGQQRAYILEFLLGNQNLIPKYKAVFADEVQDFGDVQMKLISLLCEHPSGIVFASDLGQSIYRRQSALSKIDRTLIFNSSNSVILKRSYRMTKQISSALYPLREEMAKIHKLKHQPAEPVYSGNKPLWIKAPFHMHQSRTIELISKLRESKNYNLGQFAVLFADNKAAEDFYGYCSAVSNLAATIYTKNKEVDLSQDCIHILTAHSAKGLEFPHVIMPLVNKLCCYENTEKINRFDLKEVKDKANKLLYVACSRASESLTIIQENNADPSAVDLFRLGDWEVENHPHEEFRAH